MTTPANAPRGDFAPHADAPHADERHALFDGMRRWPIVDGIPYLRAGRETLADAVLEALDARDRFEALALLLADRDAWDPTSAPPHATLRALAREIDTLTLREAMAALGYGDVATYFAHRWSDPTFVAGLGLIAAYRPRGAIRSFEVACGIGHYLRELARVGVAATGADIVFSKLWLARHYIAPTARLICFDAAAPWPVVSDAYDFVHVHDALYFLPNKPHVVREMRRVGTAAATVAVSHAHNAAVDNLSSGEPLERDGYAALFPNAVFHDDRDFAAAVATGADRIAETSGLERVPAFAFADGPSAHARFDCAGDVALPANGTALVRNPLYASHAGSRIVWPSERYEREYATLATYPMATTAPARATMSADPAIVAFARSRELVALPERW